MASLREFNNLAYEETLKIILCLRNVSKTYSDQIFLSNKAILMFISPKFYNYDLLYLYNLIDQNKIYQVLKGDWYTFNDFSGSGLWVKKNKQKH